VQKQNTEHALVTAADTDRSLQLVLQQGHATPIWTAAGQLGAMAYVNDGSAVLSRKREGAVDSFADIWKQSCALTSLSDTELVQPRLTGGGR